MCCEMGEIFNCKTYFQSFDPLKKKKKKELIEKKLFHARRIMNLLHTRIRLY